VWRKSGKSEVKGSVSKCSEVQCSEVKRSEVQ
jgi:hypothetical protein